MTRPFVIIGENVHATRVLLRNSPRIGVDESGREAILFTDASGAPRTLAIPDSERETKSYAEGRVKHVRIAVHAAMDGGADADDGLAYLEHVVRRQVEAGAHYLDLNVDEVSLSPDDQAEAMRWLVRAVERMTDVPVSVDSSSLDTIKAGFEASSGPVPMLNSASLERLDALDVAASYGAPVIVTAAGEAGMPEGTEGRVENATRMVEASLARGIPLDRIYVDPLVFPISVDSAYGEHCLEAFRQLRARFGVEIHLTGGLSNVSFGLPNRRLLNDAFLVLAIEAGADSGIIDPTTTHPERALAADRTSRPMQLALDVMTGADLFCAEYLRAFRAGGLETPEAA